MARIGALQAAVGTLALAFSAGVLVLSCGPGPAEQAPLEPPQSADTSPPAPSGPQDDVGADDPPPGWGPADAGPEHGDGEAGPQAATGPGPEEQPVDTAARDSEPEVAVAAVEPGFAIEVVEPGFAIEVVEPEEPGPGAGSGQRDDPVEPVPADEPRRSQGSVPPSAPGDVYTWHDGDRTAQAQLQLDLVVMDDGTITSTGDMAAGTGDGQTAGRGTDTGGGAGGRPVFLSESGELMTLPGGVILVLDEGWDRDAAGAFFARNGITPDRVSELDWLANGFLVETAPGFASLELANQLAAQPGVELSSPNWRRDRRPR